MRPFGEGALQYFAAIVIQGLTHSSLPWSNDSPSLIIAGAGSGKTRVLTARIAYMIEQGVAPFNILALTFTNKAAESMRERIAQMLPDNRSRYIRMGTFHSVFSRILRENAEKIGFPSRLRSTTLGLQEPHQDHRPGAEPRRREIQAQRALVAYLLCQELPRHARRLPRQLGLCRRRPAGADPRIRQCLQYLLPALQAQRRDGLRRSALADQHPAERRPGCAGPLPGAVPLYPGGRVPGHQLRPVHVIIRRLSQLHSRVCVVGDDAQSIYSFRGAKIENILSFQKDYPSAMVFKLEQNYRSTRTIVDAANSVIVRNSKRMEKHCFSEGDVGEPIRIPEGLYRPRGGRNSGYPICATRSARRATTGPKL